MNIKNWKWYTQTQDILHIDDAVLSAHTARKKARARVQRATTNKHTHKFTWSACIIFFYAVANIIMYYVWCVDDNPCRFVFFYRDVLCFSLRYFSLIFLFFFLFFLWIGLLVGLCNSVNFVSPEGRTLNHLLKHDMHTQHRHWHAQRYKLKPSHMMHMCASEWIKTQSETERQLEREWAQVCGVRTP